MIREFFLENPILYRLFSTFLASDDYLKRYVENYIRPLQGDKILDIGCGVGRLIEFLPEVRFYGFDINANYIQHANCKYAHMGCFVVSDLKQALNRGYRNFDIVNATGVIHHLDDERAKELFVLAYSALKPGGRLVTLDGCFTSEQPYVNRILLKLDRGKFVRNEETYSWLARCVFSDVRCSVKEDLIRIPYTHIMLECTKI